MHSVPWSAHLDRFTLLVWAAMLWVGASAWLFSGTPAVGALIVVAVLLATVSPCGALYATCAAIPLVFRPIEVGSLQLGLLELGILATGAGALLRGLFVTVGGQPQLSVDWLPEIRSWLLPGALLTVSTLSIVWMPFDSHRSEALRVWRWTIVEPLLLFVLACAAVSRQGRGPLTLAIVAPACLVSAAAIWQFLSGSSDFSVDGVYRSTGTYLHPNNLALYLERAAMLALVPGLLLPHRSRWPLLGVSVILFAGVAATFSRGALLGLLTGCAAVLLARPVRHGWRWLAVAAMTLALTFALLAGARLSGSESSVLLRTREYVWTGSARMLQDFPLTGIGMDQYLWLNQTRYIDPSIWSERYTSHPHNLILESWLSLGLPGLGLLACFLAAGGWVVWKLRSREMAVSPWQLGAIGCLAAGLGHGMVDNGYFLADLSAITWLAIAVVVAVPMSERDNHA